MAWIDSYKKELSDFSEMLKLKKKVVVHHRDVDGACSVSQFLKFFDCKTFSIKDPFIPDITISEIIEEKPDLLIFMDIGVDEHWERLVNIQKSLPNTPIVVIDHHTIQKDLNKIGMLHINPRLQTPKAYIPASLMVFDILNYLGFGIKDYSWIACIGVISDYGHKENVEFMNFCKKLYPGFLDAPELIDSRFGSSAKTIYSAIVLKGEYGTRKSIDLLTKASDFEDFEEDPSMKRWKAYVDKEINSVIESIEKNKEVIGNVLFFEMKSKLNLAAIIANIASEKYKNKVVVISKNSDGGWKVSTRLPKTIEVRTGSGKPVNLAEIVSKSVEGIGYGGGHPQAAGAFVENWEEFKRRVADLVNG